MKGVIGDCPRKPQTPSDTEKSQLTETKKRTEANLNEASPDYVHDNTVITAQFEGSGPASKKARPLEADDDEEEGYSADPDDNDDTEEAKESNKQTTQPSHPSAEQPMPTYGTYDDQTSDKEVAGDEEDDYDEYELAESQEEVKAEVVNPVTIQKTNQPPAEMGEIARMVQATQSDRSDNDNEEDDYSEDD